MKHRIETLPTLSLLGEKENMPQDKSTRKYFMFWMDLMKVVKNMTY